MGVYVEELENLVKDQRKYIEDLEKQCTELLQSKEGLEQLVQKLTRRSSNAEEMNGYNQTQIEYLQDLVRDYKLDAERYRWLRHGDNDEHCYYTGGHVDEYGVKNTYNSLLRVNRLDKVVDKSIQIEKEYYAGLGVIYG